MTAGGFTVTSDALEAHAEVLEGPRGRLRGAVDAATTARVVSDVVA